MMSLLRNITCLILSLAAISANAEVYNVSERFTGSSSITDLGGGQFSLTHNYNSLFSLDLGDASLFSTSMTTTISNFNPLSLVNSWCNAGCSFTETLKNGDFIFGTFNLTSLDNNFTTIVTGNTSITGGTGLFKDAVGSGFFTTSDSLALTINPKSLIATNYTVNTAPVPEPETNAMFLVGLSLIGFMVRRLKYLGE